VGFVLTGRCGEHCRYKQEAGSIRGTLSPRSFKDRAARFQHGRIHLHIAHPHIARIRHRPLTHGLVLIIISLAVGYATLTHGGFPGNDRAFAAPIAGLSLPGVNASASVANASVLRPSTINKTLRAEQPPSMQQKEEVEQFNALGAPPTPEAATEDALVRAASIAPEPTLPPYAIYQVVEGDTVSSIAARYGISPEYVIANNAEIRDSDVLTLGQSIIIPAGDGILHEVRYGETLSDIAVRYDVGVDAIAGFEPNGITQADDIAETQLVYVPGGALPVAFSEPAPGPGGADGVGAPPAAAASGGGIVGGGPSSSAGLIWPVSGPISSYYGPGHPLGIDIDGFNLGGAAIAAATSGTVVFAGGNACCSYGLYVIVMSPDGIETLYGHLSSINVGAGETVAQGQQVGIIGETGYSTGTHLHFEVIDNGVRADPLAYLP
jgi:murein DD-endopeptidase MepM/ murein hydrolase activator NlpD